MTFKESFKKNAHHFAALCGEMEKTGWPKGGGSYMIDGQTLDYNPVALPKQELYFNSVAEIDCPVILELGFYGGHSAFIALMANPMTIINSVDLCYPFSAACSDYLNIHFGGLRLTKADSHEYLRNEIADGIYNLLHIDGCHEVDHAIKDFRLSERLLQDGATVIWDDWDGFDGKVDEVFDKLTLVEIANCPNPCAKFKYKK